MFVVPADIYTTRALTEFVETAFAWNEKRTARKAK